ncbi:choline transporter [Vibrio sinensis]|uniref:Choline transporter n=1 Tax=Vibrio sinensis TaxID=2302434 RepID=A0A3A6QSG5_9VIBR|nr:BCCT family transporter [Vibrio sinensis]RJX71011.1 choline transporter [Vibrio sinensis]
MIKYKIDTGLFFPSIMAVLAITAPMIYFSDSLQGVIQELYTFLTDSFGWTYLVTVFFSMFLFGWVAFGRYGNIKIGGADEKPKFSNVSWAAMIIASGFGIGIVNWSMVEPVALLVDPPLGIESMSAEALEVAAVYGVFHWGPFYWALYLISTLPIAYFVGVRRAKRKRVSECFIPLVGEKNARGKVGKWIDIFVIFGLIGGIGVTLGSAVPLVAGLFSEVTGVQDTLTLKLAVLMMFAAVIAVSVFRSMDKGMKILSDVNGILALAILLLVLVGGPTAYLLNLSSNTIGMLLQYFPRIMTWTDPVTGGGFPAKWTIFYGAWIIAYGPMMGLFITSISYGRTLKQVIVGCMFWGSVSAFLFFMIMGGFALHLQYNEIVDVYTVYTTNSLPKAVVTVLSHMPMSKVLMGVFLLLAGVFLATTIDAATRVLAGMTSTDLEDGEEASPVSRLIWCGMIVLLVFGILLVGGMDVIQALAVGTTIPLMPISVLMLYSMVKAMKKDFGPLTDSAVLVYENGSVRSIPVEQPTEKLSSLVETECLQAKIVN